MINITEKVESKNYIEKVSVGQIVDRLMDLKNISTEDLMAKTGLSYQYIEQLRQKKTDSIYGLRLSTIRMLSEALDVPPSLFMSGCRTERRRL